MQSELGSAILAMNETMSDIQESVNRHYLCDEVTGSFVESLMESKNDSLRLEERDQNMAEEIHRLLSASRGDRYFFAVGAGV